MPLSTRYVIYTQTRNALNRGGGGGDDKRVFMEEDRGKLLAGFFLLVVLFLLGRSVRRWWVLKTKRIVRVNMSV